MRYTTTTFIFFSLTLLSVLFPGSVFAHTTGASFYSTTSPYVIDLGYDPVVAFSGESMRFDFVLSNEKTGSSVPYAQVWLRIKDEHQTLLATGIFRQPFGPTTLLYVFPKPGTYTIQPSYRDKDGNELAVASFPIEVQSTQGGVSLYIILMYGGVLLAGVVLGFALNTVLIARPVGRHQ